MSTEDRVSEADSLRRELAQRDILFAELDHRTQNTMMMIAGFLSAQAARSESLETKAALRDVMRRVQALDIAQRALNRLGALERVDLSRFLPDLLNELMSLEARHAVRLQTYVERCEVKVARASALGMTVNELATNALKHAFPHGGGILSLEVSMLAGDRGWIVIADNGVGSEDGPHLRREGGLGMHLIEALNREAGATLRMTAENGTRAELEFAIDTQN